MTGALRNARDQLEANREAKHRLEMDWSDKVRLLTVPSIFKMLFSSSPCYGLLLDWCFSHSFICRLAFNDLELSSQVGSTTDHF